MTKTLYITIGSSPETNDHVGIETLHCFGTYTTMDPCLELRQKEKLVVIIYLRINRIYNTEKFVTSRVFQPLLLTSLTSTSTSTQAFLRRRKTPFHSTIHPNAQTPAAKQQRIQTRPDQTKTMLSSHLTSVLALTGIALTSTASAAVLAPRAA